MTPDPVREFLAEFEANRDALLRELDETAEERGFPPTKPTPDE